MCITWHLQMLLCCFPALLKPTTCFFLYFNSVIKRCRAVNWKQTFQDFFQTSYLLCVPVDQLLFIEHKCQAFPVNDGLRLMKQGPCMKTITLYLKRNVFMKVGGEVGCGACEQLENGRNYGNYTQTVRQKERMWKITLLLSMFQWACPVQDCHHIAQDPVSRKSWPLTFFHSAIIPSPASDSDNAAFDKTWYCTSGWSLYNWIAAQSTVSFVILISIYKLLFFDENGNCELESFFHCAFKMFMWVQSSHSALVKIPNMFFTLSWKEEHLAYWEVQGSWRKEIRTWIMPCFKLTKGKQLFIKGLVKVPIENERTQRRSLTQKLSLHIRKHLFLCCVKMLVHFLEK